MLRLVTQFDEPSARPGAATPTCGGCCSCSCCCCCLAATITTTAYTTLNLRETAARAGVDPNRADLAEFLGCFSFMTLLPGAVGALAVIAMIFFSDVDMDWRFVPPAILWPAALYGLYRYAGDRQPARSAGCVWIVGMILFTIELGLGAVALLANPWLYVICMPLAAIAGVWCVRRLANA